MGLKIDLIRTTVPVEIGEYTFDVDISQKGAQHFAQTVEQLAKEMSAITTKLKKRKITDEVADKKAEELLSKVIDDLLGKGAFAKIYEQTPNIDAIIEYYMAICLGLTNEIDDKTTIDRERRDNLDKKYSKYLG